MIQYVEVDKTLKKTGAFGIGKDFYIVKIIRNSLNILDSEIDGKQFQTFDEVLAFMGEYDYILSGVIGDNLITKKGYFYKKIN